MKKDFKGRSKSGGVYKITDQTNGMFYIGSAKCFQVRASQHLSKLKQGKHANKHLQNAFNKHGGDVFLFEVLEVVDGTKNNRFIVEQNYINKLINEGKWEQTFNFKKKTEQKERDCFSRTPEESKKLLSQKSKAMWTDPKHRIKLKKIHSDPEWIKNQSEKQKKVSQDPNNGNSGAAHRKKYSNPKEREKLSKKLKEAWVRDDGSRRKKASKRAKEIYEANKEKIAKARLKAKAKYYGKVVSPEGKVFEIYNAQAFIREHAFSQMFYELLNGKYESYKGWKRVE